MKKLIRFNHNLKNGSLYLLGNLFDKAISFVTVPVFTRLMTTAEYGIVSTYSSFVSIISVIIGLELSGTIRNAYVDFHNEYEKYISSVFVLSLVSFLLFSGVSIMLNLKFSFVAMPMLICCFLQAFNNGKINSIVSKFMMEENAIMRTFFQVFPNLCAAIISVIFVCNMTSNKEYGRIIPMCIVATIFGGGVFFWYLIHKREFINLHYWKYGLAISIPLIFHGLSVNILSSSDRMILTAFCNASETGVYSVVYNFGMLATVITASLEGVWIPFFTKQMINGNKMVINEVSQQYVKICTFLFCALIVVGPEILIIFASKKYINGISLIVPIVLASYFQFLYSLAVNLEFYYKRTKIIAFNTMLAAGINFMLNLILIPRYGALAAALTTVIAYVVSFLSHFSYCKRIDRELFPIKMYKFSVLMLGIVVIFQYLTINLIAVRWGGGILFLSIMFGLYCRKNKKFLQNFFN